MGANERRTGGGRIIDCDLHQGYRKREEITKYLPDRYQHRGITVPSINYANPGGMGRPSAQPDDLDDFEFCGSDYEKIKKNHLDKHDVEYALLTGHTILSISATPNRDYAFELAKAYNRWVLDEWLPKDDRFVASLLIAVQNPTKSAEMIREMGSHPRVVEVLIQGGGSRLPFGHPYYWPIYEAAEELDLPVAIHPSKAGHGVSPPPTGAGHPSNYLEWHTLIPTVFIGQLANVITQGVFVEFPDLDMVFKECDFTWLPFLMWRMDSEWKAVRSQTPWLTQPPSEYVLEHCKFTTQPAHLPENSEHFLQIMEMIRAEETLLFSSDYPHWDADEPGSALPPMPDEMAERIYYENAKELYGLSNLQTGG